MLEQEVFVLVFPESGIDLLFGEVGAEANPPDLRSCTAIGPDSVLPIDIFSGCVLKINGLTAGGGDGVVFIADTGGATARHQSIFQ